MPKSLAEVYEQVIEDLQYGLIEIRREAEAEAKDPGSYDEDITAYVIRMVTKTLETAAGRTK